MGFELNKVKRLYGVTKEFSPLPAGASGQAIYNQGYLQLGGAKAPTYISSGLQQPGTDQTGGLDLGGGGAGGAGGTDGGASGGVPAGSMTLADASNLLRQRGIPFGGQAGSKLKDAQAIANYLGITITNGDRTYSPDPNYRPGTFPGGATSGVAGITPISLTDARNALIQAGVTYGALPGSQLHGAQEIADFLQVPIKSGDKTYTPGLPTPGQTPPTSIPTGPLTIEQARQFFTNANIPFGNQVGSVLHGPQQMADYLRQPVVKDGVTYYPSKTGTETAVTTAAIPGLISGFSVPTSGPLTLDQAAQLLYQRNVPFGNQTGSALHTAQEIANFLGMPIISGANTYNPSTASAGTTGTSATQMTVSPSGMSLADASLYLRQKGIPFGGQEGSALRSGQDIANYLGVPINSGATVYQPTGTPGRLPQAPTQAATAAQPTTPTQSTAPTQAATITPTRAVTPTVTAAPTKAATATPTSFVNPFQLSPEIIANIQKMAGGTAQAIAPTQAAVTKPLTVSTTPSTGLVGPAAPSVKLPSPTLPAGPLAQTNTLPNPFNIDPKILQNIRAGFGLNFAKGGPVKMQGGGMMDIPEYIRAPEDQQPSQLSNYDALAQMLGEHDYTDELQKAREASQAQQDALLKMVERGGGDDSNSKAEMYFRLAAALGQPTRTGTLGETIGNVGQAMAESSRAGRERQMAQRQLGLEAQKIRAGIAKEDLESVQNLAKEQLAARRALAIEKVKQELTPVEERKLELQARQADIAERRAGAAETMAAAAERRAAAAENKPEPIKTVNVLDPQDPSSIWTVDANKYVPGSPMIDPATKQPSAGVLGKTGKEPTAAAKQEAMLQGADLFDTTTSEIQKKLDFLKENKAIISKDNTKPENYAISARLSGLGQQVARAGGSESQSAIDVIGSSRLQLLNAFKQATGMGQKAIDSNAELKTWLSSLGDIHMSYESQKEILNNLVKFANEKREKALKESTMKPSSSVTSSSDQMSDEDLLNYHLGQ